MTPQRKIDHALRQMRAAPSAVSFRDLDVVCRHFFGEPRVAAGSHRIYATPWRGDPRVNIQNDHGRAKAYQVRQVLAAIDRLTEDTEHRWTEGDHA
ncbi:MAG: toxin HicA [Microcella sp.]